MQSIRAPLHAHYVTHILSGTDAEIAATRLIPASIPHCLVR